MTAIKTIALLFALFGYYAWLRKTLNVHDAFIPIIINSGIALLVLISGILNILTIGVYLVLFIGIMLGIRYFSQIRHLSVHIIIYAAICTLVFFCLYNKLLLNQDNFSHWALVVKVMLSTNSLPTFKTPFIIYQAYPLAASCFIYFFCRLLSFSEGLMLFVQAIFIFSALYSLSAFINNRKALAQSIFFAAACIFILTSDVQLTDLLVDTLLPSVAIAVFSIYVFYQTRMHFALLLSLPLLCTMLMIKNSALIFFLYSIICAIFFIFRSKSFRECRVLLAANILCPLGFELIWAKHVKLVFENGTSSYHAMTPGNIQEGFLKKSSAEIDQIVSLFLKTYLQPYSKPVLLLLSALILILLIVLLRRKNPHNMTVLAFGAFLLSVFITYGVGLLAMYLTTMASAESVNLNGYSRYLGSLTIYIVGILLVFLFQLLNTESLCKTNRPFRVIITLIACLTLCYVTVSSQDRLKSLISSQNISGTVRSRLDNILQENDLYGKDEMTFTIYISDDYAYSDYIYYYFYYSLLAKQYYLALDTTFDGHTANFLNSDYLIIWKHDTRIDALMQENGYDITQDCLRIYKQIGR